MGEIHEIMLNEKAGNEKEYICSWYEIYKNHLCRHPRWEEEIRGGKYFSLIVKIYFYSVLNKKKTFSVIRIPIAYLLSWNPMWQNKNALSWQFST